MGKERPEPPLDIEDVLTTLANVADWQRQLALGALQQLREDKRDAPADPTPPAANP